MESIKVINRTTKQLKITKETKITLFLYNTLLGRIILKLITLPFFSKIGGLFLSTSFSKIFLKIFINKNKIDMSSYPKVKYKSFNDFFSREITKEKRPINKTPNLLISPCDGKISCYKINKENKFKIKGSYYSILSLLESDVYKEYNNGTALIIRLGVDDYHRYSYIDDGTKEDNHFIKGILHTVRPIALNNYDIYKKNQREYTILNTKNFDKVIQVEVGALMVGKIINHHQKHSFKRGEEKGYFKFGGSTIVLLFKDNIIKIDQDIIENTKKRIETTIKLGEQIGKKIS